MTWRRDAAFRGAVNTLSSDLALAKQSAIKRNARVVVQFDANGYTIFVDNGEGGGTAKDGTRQPNERIIVQRAAVPSVSITGDPITFDAKGLSTAANTVSVTLTAGPNNSTVSVNRVGKINIIWYA
ncbi:GspH/FimT family protein [Desulfosarcina sp. OttesenSCG-928-G10]|nr:GspH/FimT family protein [Desulfosarcina sp. OttesenSCG-928-G10]